MAWSACVGLHTSSLIATLQMSWWMLLLVGSLDDWHRLSMATTFSNTSSSILPLIMDFRASFSNSSTYRRKEDVSMSSLTELVTRTDCKDALAINMGNIPVRIKQCENILPNVVNIVSSEEDNQLASLRVYTRHTFHITIKIIISLEEYCLLAQISLLLFLLWNVLTRKYVVCYHQTHNYSFTNISVTLLRLTAIECGGCDIKRARTTDLKLEKSFASAYIIEYNTECISYVKPVSYSQLFVVVVHAC